MNEESQLEKELKQSKWSRLVGETIDYIEFRSQHPNCTPDKRTYFRNCMNILSGEPSQHERYQTVAKGDKAVNGHFYSME